MIQMNPVSVGITEKSLSNIL